jgi:hypothetical protein
MLCVFREHSMCSVRGTCNHSNGSKGCNCASLRHTGCCSKLYEYFIEHMSKQLILIAFFPVHIEKVTLFNEA